jgi:hypothetical protein
LVLIRVIGVEVLPLSGSPPEIRRLGVSIDPISLIGPCTVIFIYLLFWVLSRAIGDDFRRQLAFLARSS